MAEGGNTMYSHAKEVRNHFQLVPVSVLHLELQAMPYTPKKQADRQPKQGSAQVFKITSCISL